MESSNVLINDELSLKSHSENTSSVQEKIMKVDDSLLDDYVGKFSEEDLMLLNDIVSVPSSSEPSTPIHETQQEQNELSRPSE